MTRSRASTSSSAKPRSSKIAGMLLTERGPSGPVFISWALASPAFVIRPSRSGTILASRLRPEPQGFAMVATSDESNAGGYSVAYGRDDSYFPVYITAALALIFLAASWITGALYWLPLALTAAAFSYCNMPRCETGRPTIGANQYGIFIQAFGLIRWRAIEGIHLVQIAERAMTVHELQIVLNAPLGSALVADWRKQPTYRLLMRLPWCMDHGGVVRVNLEPFDQPADGIHRTFLRMWRYYRS